MSTTRGRTRRKHNDEFRAMVLAQCREPGKSTASVALEHGLNASLIRVWLRKSAQDPVHQSLSQPAESSAVLASQQFLPVRMEVSRARDNSAAKPSAAIELELRRGTSAVTVTWPAELAGDCGAWLCEWLR